MYSTCMQGKKNISEVQNAILISLMIALLLEAIDALRWVTSWIATNWMKVGETWAYAISFIVTVVLLLIYIFGIISWINSSAKSSE